MRAGGQRVRRGQRVSDDEETVRVTVQVSRALLGLLGLLNLLGARRPGPVLCLDGRMTDCGAGWVRPSKDKVTREVALGWGWAGPGCAGGWSWP